MADSYEVVSEQSWGQRLGGSIKGIFSGILIGAAGVVLLFWGEGRAVKRAQLLDQGASTVVSVDAAAPSPAHEGDLVHFIDGRQGALACPETFVPVDAAIIGFVEEVHSRGRDISGEGR